MRRVAALKPPGVALLIATLALTSCVLPARERGPFPGKVVVAETGEPIAGAVVLVEWRRIVHIMGGTAFYDLRVDVTDTQGRFEIPRLPTPWRLGVQPPRVAWFVPGYATVNVVHDPSPDRRAFVPTLIEMRERKHFDRKTLLTLPLGHFESLPLGMPAETIRALNTVVNARRRALGLPPLGRYSWSHPIPDHEERRNSEAPPRVPTRPPLPPPTFVR